MSLCFLLLKQPIKYASQKKNVNPIHILSNSFLQETFYVIHQLQGKAQNVCGFPQIRYPHTAFTFSKPKSISELYSEMTKSGLSLTVTQWHIDQGNQESETQTVWVNRDTTVHIPQVATGRCLQSDKNVPGKWLLSPIFKLLLFL